MKKEWVIKLALVNDLERWMAFVKTVQNEFHGIDLINDKKFISHIIKNIKRSTAVYTEKPGSAEIIGAMTYSPNSLHIGWLAVGQAYRHRGIGTALVRHMLVKFPDDTVFQVKTFLESDIPGKTAHGFYQSLGFKPEEIVEDIENENAGHPFHLFIRK